MVGLVVHLWAQHNPRDDDVEKWSAARRDEEKKRNEGKKEVAIQSDDDDDGKSQTLSSPIPAGFHGGNIATVRKFTCPRRSLVGASSFEPFYHFFQRKIYNFFRFTIRPLGEFQSRRRGDEETTNAVCASLTKMANVQPYAIKTRSAGDYLLSLSFRWQIVCSCNVL